MTIRLKLFLTRLRALLATHYKTLIVLFFAILLPLGLFGLITDNVIYGKGTPVDREILLYLHHHSNHFLDNLMYLFTTMGGIAVMGPTVLLLLAYWIYKRQYSKASFFALAIFGAIAINVTTKQIFERARPSLWAPLHPLTSFSFPSGHSMQSMALAVALTIIFWQSRYRYLIAILLFAFALAVGLSRIYLGVHYPTDVLAAYLASIGWVSSVAYLLRRRLFIAKQEEDIRPSQDSV